MGRQPELPWFTAASPIQQREAQREKEERAKVEKQPTLQKEESRGSENGQLQRKLSLIVSENNPEV